MTGLNPDIRSHIQSVINSVAILRTFLYGLVDLLWWDGAAWYEISFHFISSTLISSSTDQPGHKERFAKWPRYWWLIEHVSKCRDLNRSLSGNVAYDVIIIQWEAFISPNTCIAEQDIRWLCVCFFIRNVTFANIFWKCFVPRNSFISGIWCLCNPL